MLYNYTELLARQSAILAEIDSARFDDDNESEVLALLYQELTSISACLLAILRK